MSPGIVVAAILTSITACASGRPSAWALNSTAFDGVTTGRIVRFGANGGRPTPIPALVYRERNGRVQGQLLVWYYRYEKQDAGYRPTADSLPMWNTMQATMDRNRARLELSYGCRHWVKGNQFGQAWVCRVPDHNLAPDWGAQLRSVDSLIKAHHWAECQGCGLDSGEVAIPRPDPAKLTIGPIDWSCHPTRSWYVVVTDSASRGRGVQSPGPFDHCPQPDGPQAWYDYAGWRMLEEFVDAAMGMEKRPETEGR